MRYKWTFFTLIIGIQSKEKEKRAPTICNMHTVMLSKPVNFDAYQRGPISLMFGVKRLTQSIIIIWPTLGTTELQSEKSYRYCRNDCDLR